MGGHITFIRLGSRFIYLAVILDAYTRSVRGWALSRRLTADILSVSALYMALESGIPSIFHSDQGSQYTACPHLEPLLTLEVIISILTPVSHLRTVWLNASSAFLILSVHQAIFISEIIQISAKLSK